MGWAELSEDWAEERRGERVMIEREMTARQKSTAL
jgi:hypothetical protein